MYKLLFLLITIPFLLKAQEPLPQKLQNEAKVYKKKKVKTIEIYVTVNGESKRLSETKQYDKKGYLIEEAGENQYGEKYTMEYSYNKKGQLIGKYKVNEEGSTIEKTLFGYNKKTLIYEKHEEEEYPYTLTYIYNKKGIIDSTYLAAAEFRKNKWYITNGKVKTIIGYTVYDLEKPNNWEEVDRMEYSYDEEGNQTKVASCYKNQGCYTSIFEYNKEGQKVKMVNKGPSADMGISTFEYNEKGLLTKEIFTPSEDMADYMEKKTYEYKYTFY